MILNVPHFLAGAETAAPDARVPSRIETTMADRIAEVVAEGEKQTPERLLERCFESLELATGI